MARKRSNESSEEKIRTTSKIVNFYKFIKTPGPMNVISEEKSACDLINHLSQYKLPHNLGTSNRKGALPVAEDISKDSGFENSFKLTYRKKIFNFFIINDNEIFATFGKKDSPLNAKVELKDGLCFNEFTIEFFSFFYMNVKDNILSVMHGNHIPNISESFVELCNLASPNFNYELVCILDQKIWDRFRKAKAVNEVSIKIAAPNLNLLKKSALSDEEVFAVASKQFTLIEARLVFESKITSERVTKNTITKLISAFKTSSAVISDLAVKFSDEELRDEIVRATENAYGKTVKIPVDQKFKPIVIYNAMKEAYNENRTSVLENIMN